MLKYLPWKRMKEEESIQFFMACFVFQYFCFQIVQSGHTLCLRLAEAWKQHTLFVVAE